MNFCPIEKLNQEKEKIAKIDCEIYAIVVDKSKIIPNLYEVKDRLYNFLCRILLEEIESADKMIITIDRKHTNTLIRENFNEYIQHNLKMKNRAREIEIKHVPSASSQPLQVVDFIVWSIARKRKVLMVRQGIACHSIISYSLNNYDQRTSYVKSVTIAGKGSYTFIH